jgi:hypothetical protein
MRCSVVRTSLTRESILKQNYKYSTLRQLHTKLITKRLHSTGLKNCDAVDSVTFPCIIFPSISWFLFRFVKFVKFIKRQEVT